MLVAAMAAARDLLQRAQVPNSFLGFVVFVVLVALGPVTIALWLVVAAWERVSA